jgi:hypothetical protein
VIGSVDRTIAINLRKRPDRWGRFCSEVASVADWPFPRPVRFDAIDGTSGVGSWWRGTPGSWGCWQSHLAVIRGAMDAGLRAVLIMEDDAFFCPTFASDYSAFAASVPGDWEQVYLGGQFSDDFGPFVTVAPGVLWPRAVIRTHAYLLHCRAFSRVVSLFQDEDWIRCVDRWHVDGMYRALHESGMLRVYAPTRFLVGQDEGTSDVFAGEIHGPRYWNREV